MKTALWFIIISIFFKLSVFGQEKNKMIIDEKFEKEILIGYCDREGLMLDEFKEEFSHEYHEYCAQRKIINKIRKLDQDYVIVMVLATWCHDSKEQVPRFYRILDEAGIPADVITGICVDGEKLGGDIPIDNYKLEYVPTFIFYRNGKEIGRIIETPEVSLEEDMLKIID
jgi:thiol-disulfide isomerase/thioredoxin